MHLNGSANNQVEHPWWLNAVYYRIDVRSFADSDGNGIGDLDGLRARLGYLELLGVDAIVLAGTGRNEPATESFAALVGEAHEAGIRVLLATDLDPAETDPQQALLPWLEFGIDGFHIAPRDDLSGAIGSAVAAYPDRVVIGSGKGRWHLHFNLDLAVAGFQAEKVQDAIDRILGSSSARPAWAMASHGSDRIRDEAALTPVRAMALVQLALPGAVCLRHGEELGIPGTQPIPMPWEGTEPPFGFSPTAGEWSAIPPEWADFTVEAQLEDPDSTLSLYRHALETRSAHASGGTSGIEWYGAPEGCFAFRRKDTNLTCALNTTDEPVPVPPGEVLLSSRPLLDGELPPGSAVWLA